MREEAVEEILDSLQFSYRTTVRIWVYNRKNLRSWYAALTSKSKTDTTKIYLDACYLSPPWNPGNSEDPKQSWARLLLRTLQKISEKNQDGINIQIYGSTTS
ncbi:hypothetical protein ACTXT7_010643, partial [Hymenolepis weldensis]